MIAIPSVFFVPKINGFYDSYLIHIYKFSQIIMPDFRTWNTMTCYFQSKKVIIFLSKK